MTGLDLTAIAARVPEWYAAPWRYDFEGDQWWVGYATDSPLAGLIATVPDYGERLAEFIAHAREDVPALLAEVKRYERVQRNFASHALAPIAAWMHACGHIEWLAADWRPTDGGCDACESGSDIPADWQPLYVRRGGEPS